MGQMILVKGSLSFTDDYAIADIIFTSGKAIVLHGLTCGYSWGKSVLKAIGKTNASTHDYFVLSSENTYDYQFQFFDGGECDLEALIGELKVRNLISNDDEVDDDAMTKYMDEEISEIDQMAQVTREFLHDHSHGLARYVDSENYVAGLVKGAADFGVTIDRNIDKKKLLVASLAMAD